jgi:large subunit ribosomal protein L5
MAKAKQMQRLEKLYKEKISLELHKEFGYKSIMQVPKITKIVVNMGVGDAVQDTKRLDNAAAELTQITGQKPLITKAKKSLAAFKLREGMPIGAKVTLRGKRMYDFLDKLVSVALPRVRDFRGVSKNGFDSQANYTMGIKEQIIFPEIDYDKVQKVRGMDITIVNTAKERKEAFSLLQKLGMPFEK